MTKPIRAQSPLKFLAPHFNPLVLAAIYRLLPFYLRSQCQIERVEGENSEILVDCYRRFQAGQLRFLLAYRHSSTNDPPSLIHYLHTNLPKIAANEGISLNKPVFGYFLYDRGIPLWAGPVANWLLPAIGGVPVIRGRPDFGCLRTLRHLYVRGQFPLAIAPEGYTNGHGELVSRLELGCAQTSFWCVEDLVAAGENQQVSIVPIGVRYQYLENPWPKIWQLCRAIERECGFPPGDGANRQLENSLSSREWNPEQQLTPEEEALLYPKLLRIAEYLLEQMESFYRRFHTAIQLEEQAAKLANLSPIEGLTLRLQGLMDAVLKMLEGYLQMHPHSDRNLIERAHDIEDTVWDWIYRRDVDIQTLSDVERGLADLVASEAHQHLWHMRWVENFVVVTGHYLQNKPTARRFAETLLMINALIHEITGKGQARPAIAPQKAIITVAEPLDVTARWHSTYQRDGAAKKQAVRELTSTLKKSLESMTNP